jgi:hypothetical protein
MKVVTTFIITILLVSACPAGDKFILESAIGFGSRHMPYSSKWEGAVKSGALEYREFAARGIYPINKLFSVSLTAGWINDLLIPKNNYIVFYKGANAGNG